MLDGRHYNVAGHRQRMLFSEWQKILLNYEDTITFKGSVVRLVAKNMGFGLVEVSKDLGDKDEH